MTVEILNGNELLIQGGREAGFSLYTGYPGSPLADFFNILERQKEQLKAEGIKVVIANSEANAAAMASGAKMAGQDTLIAMKSMGLHVASDALSVGNFANSGKEFIDRNTGETLSPGVVIAVGDDPWSISTSTPADSRYLFKHLHIPFLEPSNPTELKEWMKKALEISQKSSVYCGILLTTFMAEGGGRVELGETKAPRNPEVTLDPKTFDLSKHVMVPPNSLGADKAMIEERFPTVIKALEQMDLDQVYGKKSKIGLISSGLVFETLKHVLEERGLLDKVILYKLGCSYPLTKKKLLPFLKAVDKVLVVEEKRSFLETEIRNFCLDNAITPLIWGKKFAEEEGFAAFGGLNFENIDEGLNRSLSMWGVEYQKEQISSYSLQVPRRLPTFCPGCPHRETLSLLKDLRKTLDQRNIDLISHGDVGCYSLAFLEPFKEMHDLSAMGQGGAMASGTDLFATNPSIVLMGDSTFFHSGMSAISHSVQCGHDITYILLDNDNTAMTGHQMTPATGVSVDGQTRPRQKMALIAKSLGAADVHEVNPSDRYFYKNLLEEIVLKKGTKIIVSDKECGLTFHGRRKSHERKLFSSGKSKKRQSFYQINTLACEDCRVCIDSTGCPGLTLDEDAYGPKIAIDQQICVADSYCTKLQACPSFEHIEVLDFKPPTFEVAEIENLPLPKVRFSLDDLEAMKTFRIVVTGVGGSGVTTISRVIAEACRSIPAEKKCNFKFVDQKGLAQRNGSVTGHLCLYREGDSQSAITPIGKGNLIISPDALEASRAIGFLSDSGAVICDKGFQVPLSLLGEKKYRSESFDIEELNSELEEILTDRLYQGDFKKQSFEKWGKSVYSSAMCLGLAFQSGYLPFSLEQIEDALSKVVPKAEIKNNLAAFQFGRAYFEEKKIEEPKQEEEKKLDLSHWEESLKESVAFYENESYILARFRNSIQSVTQILPAFAEQLAHYIHDLMIFDRGKMMEKFLVEVEALKRLYTEESELKISLRNLARSYWLKDEVFVSHLMISSAIRKRDEQYLKLGSSYKLHFKNRPAIDLFGNSVEINISPRAWMFKIMRHFRFLRKLFPGWHAKDKQIAKHIRMEILERVPSLVKEDQKKRLEELDQIKGYRQVKYEKAKEFISSLGELS